MAWRLARSLKGVAAAVLLGSFLVVLYGLYRLSHMPPEKLEERFPARIYSGSFVVTPGAPVSAEGLETRLMRLGYVSTEDPPQAPGRYLRGGGDFEIHLRGFPQSLWPAPQRRVELSLDRKGRARCDGPFWLEPELLAELRAPEGIQREAVRFEELPDHLVHAVVSVEDRRFFDHWGVDLLALGRATLANLRAGRAVQGGSTITQQVVKNLFLVPRKALWRKAAELVLALYLETRYSKGEILTLYLNQSYWGQSGRVSIAGVKAAARFYFDKSLFQLTVSESALLAGLLRSPLRYNPFRDPQAALERRNFVLRAMHRSGRLEPSLYQQAVREELRMNPSPHPPTGKADYFVAEVTQELLERYPDDVVLRRGISVYTTLDPLLQEIAQAAAVSSTSGGQAALVSLDPHSGAVLALVGGKSFTRSQFNRATQARRQPGSAFKPFVYGAALRSRAEDGRPFTAASLLLDEPRKYPTPQGPWSPENYDGVYHGTATFRRALAFSMNSATVGLAKSVGPRAVAEYARMLGIHSPLRLELGLALGASEVTLLELTAAYAAFANGGRAVWPYLIEAVVDREGEVLQRRQPQTEQALRPGEAYLMTSLLEGVVRDGTAKSLVAMGFARPAAGKTGTSSDGRDAWFIGYTPGLLTGVWVGEDRPVSLQVTGASAALPIWASVMRQALAGRPEEAFEIPEDVGWIKVDPANGLRAVSGCPNAVRELFLTGAPPPGFCPLHPGGVKGWFQRFLR